jgi:hypothetical protein
VFEVHWGARYVVFIDEGEPTGGSLRGSCSP